jgi:hypothetical protein
MAEVYLSSVRNNLGLIELVALKAIRPEFADDPGLVRMFFDEAKITRQLRHPNITQLVDYGNDAGTPYLVMEYVCGVNLKQIIRKGTIPASLTMAVGHRVAQALHSAHSQTDEEGVPLGIVHRDVTPHNVMLSFDGNVKLLDFGIAVARVRAERTGTGVLKGKWAYMSPEHVLGEGVDCRSDIFSLGALLYEMVSGRRAFPGSSPSEVLGRVAYGDPDPLPPDMMPPALDRVIRTCLEKNKSNRYQTAYDVVVALDAAQQQLGFNEHEANMAEFVLGRFTKLHNVVLGTLREVEKEAFEALGQGEAAAEEDDCYDDDNEAEEFLDAKTVVAPAPFEQLAGDHDPLDSSYPAVEESGMSGSDVAPGVFGGDPNRTLEDTGSSAEQLFDDESVSNHEIPPPVAGVTSAEPPAVPIQVEQRPIGQAPLGQSAAAPLEVEDESGIDVELVLTIAVGIATGLVITILAWYFDLF